MTRFLDVAALIGLVQTIGLEKLLAEMGTYISDDYCHWEEFEKSPRLASHSSQGVIELMPTANSTLYGFKYVNGHPINTQKGLPTVMAFGVLAEVSTGLPIFLSEMTIATALRTAATSAVVAKAMAKPGSRTMAVIGCGAQSEFQILAFKSIVGITNVTIYDINHDTAVKLQKNLADIKSLTVTIAASTAEAVKNADIVTTLTAAKTKAVILTPEMIEPGMHLNAVGGDCPGKTELHAAILKHARVAVEFEPQSRIEGEIQQMPADFKVIHLWQIFSGLEKGRESPDQVTIFDSVGFALEDFSALRYLNDMAAKYEAGTFIDLVPDLANPKDLFAALRKKR